MITIYIIASLLVLTFIVVPIFIAYSERERANIIKYDLVNKLSRLVKPSDIVSAMSSGCAKIPIDYTLNNQILLLNDKEEDYLIEDVTKTLNNSSLVCGISEKISVEFSNEKNHPYNFLVLTLENK